MSDAVISCGLAEIMTDLEEPMVYVCGSEKQFSWLIQRQEAGRKGGRPKKATESDRLTDESGSNPLTLSLPLTPSLKRSKNNTITSEVKKTRTETWEAYRSAYAARYGVDPTRNASVNGQIAKFIERVGDDAPFVAAFYLSHNDQYYVRQVHAFKALLGNAENMRTQWQLQQKITGTRAREIEREQGSEISVSELAAALKDQEPLFALRPEVKRLAGGGS